MYVTAHRVRTRMREEGINAYYYRHEPYLWNEPPPPEENPGQLVNTLLTVDAIGGNSVRSFVDVTAPDEFLWPHIEPMFLKFIEAYRHTPFPWAAVVGPCLFRLGMERTLARSWRRELRLLYKACVLVHPMVQG